MSKLKKILAFCAAVAVAVVVMILGKWYHTTTSETIDPKRGVYGMDGMEIWVDVNARMPDSARLWACETLRAREAVVLGGSNTMAPYSCQPGFSTAVSVAPYDSVVNANLGQALAGLSPEKAQALRACFDAAMATAVTPEAIAAFNDDLTAEGGKDVIIAASTAARACKAEVGS